MDLGSTNDRKITCETLADNTPNNVTAGETTEDVNAPPESFWLSKDAEFDWFDRNAFIERSESTKGNSNTNSNSNYNNSQRFVSNLKSKAGIIGLPKTQKNNYGADVKRRQCRISKMKLFPKRTNSVGKTTRRTISIAEPSSPKVSCIGRVRSKRRSRSVRKKDQKTIVDQKKQDSASVKKLGLLFRLTSIFGSDSQRRKKNKRSEKVNEPVEESGTRKALEYWTGGGGGGGCGGVVGEPPSIGAMTRFVSGRRSNAFGAVDSDGGSAGR